MTKNQIIERILHTLEGQRFTDWYLKNFDDYITGDLEYKEKLSKDEAKNKIKQEIEKIFGL